MSDIHSTIIEYLTNKNNPIILDVGCYLAEDASEFAGVLSSSQVFAFEADPRNIEYLKNHVVLPQNVKLIEGAISNYDGVTDFYCSNDIDMTRDWKLSGSVNKPTGHLKEYTVRFSAKPITVFCQKLDTWYKNSPIHDKNIDLIWVDTNGAEREFLEGARDTLLKTQLVYIECFEQELYHGQVDCTWITNFLKNLGFEYILSFGHNNLYGNQDYGH